MKKIISFAAAFAVAAASFSTIASAETIGVGLDIKTKWDGTGFNDHPEESPKSLSVGESQSFDSEARLSMEEVAKKWVDHLDSDLAKAFIENNGGGDAGRAALLDAVKLTGTYTLEIAPSEVIDNAKKNDFEDGKSPVLNWKDTEAVDGEGNAYNVEDFFVQDGPITYSDETKTWTVTMKVIDDETVDVNNALDKYFTALNEEAAKEGGDTSKYDFILEIDDSTINTSSVGTYSVKGTFTGSVTIQIDSLSKSKTYDFGPTTDTEYIAVATATAAPSRSRGGGGSHTVTTAAPTQKPFAAERVEPLSDTIAEGYDSEETIQELGDITGFAVDVTNSDGTTGVYGEDYTISDKDGHVLTPAEVNALLANPDIVLSDYNVNLAAGANAVTRALYKSGAQIDYNNHFAYIIGYPEGDVRPQNNISRAEVATIFFRLLTDDSRAEYWNTTNNFSDVSSDTWYNNAISTVANAGIVRGYEDGTFRPDAPITRAEFATIASRFAAANGVIVADFSDISGHWAEASVKKAASVGWVTGYEDGTFRPNNNITRAEAMAIVNRVTFRLVEADGVHANAIKWSDNPESAWYYAIVEEATNSHTYTRGTIGDNESWTEITEHRDWSKLEKETSDRAAVIVGIENGALEYENNDGSVITVEK